MSKDVVVSKNDANLPANVTALTGLAQAATATAGSLGTGDAFGQFTKLGEWLFGQERIEVEEDSQWAINPLSLKHGFIHWPDEGRPTEHMVSATQPLPQLADLPVVDGDWNKNASFQAVCLSGEDKGQQVIFKGSSLGFRKAWGEVATAIANQAVGGTGEVVPVVTLDSDSYTHKQYGKIMTPAIEIVGWNTLDDAEPNEAEAEEEKPEPKAEAKPARRRRRRKAS